jgi:hypothetical protein
MGHNMQLIVLLFELLYLHDSIDRSAAGQDYEERGHYGYFADEAKCFYDYNGAGFYIMRAFLPVFYALNAVYCILVRRAYQRDDCIRGDGRAGNKTKTGSKLKRFGKFIIEAIGKLTVGSERFRAGNTAGRGLIHEILCRRI